MPALRFPERIARLQTTLRRRRLSALLVTQPGNRRYLSGYSALDHDIQESSGVLLVPARGTPYLLTDSRFYLQAEKEARGFTVQLYPHGLIALLRQQLPQQGIRHLAFESHYMLHSTAARLQKTVLGLGLELHPVTEVVERLRVVKSEDEIEALRASVRLNEQVFQKVYPAVKPGMTELEVALALETTMRRLGARGPAFETIVAFGPNAARPHAVPTDRTLAPGEMVLIDMGLVLNGYCSDMTRTFVAGRPEQTFVDRLRLVRRAQLAGMNAIRAGVTCRAVDMAARAIIRDAGYGKFFGHALGHGVGLDVHEHPHLSSGSRKQLRSGMVVTVEPGIYLPDWGGIRLENMVVVRDHGCELLNSDLTSLDL